jgi:hypothetical protein
VHVLATTDAYVEARSGRFEDLCDRHTQRAKSIPAIDAAKGGGTLTILHAFALDALGRGEEADRTMAELSDEARAIPRASLAYRWPEMTSFLEAHGLSTEPPRSA